MPHSLGKVGLLKRSGWVAVRMKLRRKFFIVWLVISVELLAASHRLFSAQAGDTNSPWLQIILTNGVVVLNVGDLTTNAGGIHDVFLTTNLMVPGGWMWLARCGPGQTTLVMTNCPPDQAFFQLAVTNAIRPGFTNDALPAEDDSPSVQTVMPLAIDFYGNVYSNVWVNNNGNVTFNGPQSAYTPTPLSYLGNSIIAPYWADVDTSSPYSAVVTYGTNLVDGHAAFGVNWVNVGYYSSHADKLLSCQLVILDRSDIVPGGFDMEFNYFQVQWEWGDVSKNNPPHAGFSNGISDVELPYSGVEGAYLDTNTVTGLIYNSTNSPVPGRYVFYFRNGTPSAEP